MEATADSRETVEQKYRNFGAKCPQIDYKSVQK